MTRLPVGPLLSRLGQPGDWTKAGITPNLADILATQFGWHPHEIWGSAFHAGIDVTAVYDCPFCDRSYATVHGLRIHRGRTHPDRI